VDSADTDRIAAWCREHLGSVPVQVFFSATSMSSVRGVILADGRRVALKVRASSQRVLACAEAHRLARASGIDCPELLAGPSLLEPGTWVSAEEWRPDGSSSPPAEAAASYALLLRQMVEALAQLEPRRFEPPPPWAYYDHAEPGRVWPPAASQRWDPESPVVPPQVRRLAAAARDACWPSGSPR